MTLREVSRVGEVEKNVPKLRFKGYEDAWEQRKLGDIADKVTVKNSNLQYIETFTNSAEVGIISQRDYFDHDIANLSNLDGYYIVQKEDFVYNPRISTSAPVGPINRNKLGRVGVMSPLYTVFRTHNVDTTYLEYFFKSQYWHSFMKFHGDSGARSDRFSIKDAIFFEMPIPLPDIDEQQKIGDYLNCVDHLITLHQRKYNALKSMKKTLLSKMFPKDGKDVPDIRFKEFTDAWEQWKLGEVTEKFEYGLNAAATDFDGVNQYLRITDIDDESREFNKTSLTSPDTNLALADNYLLKQGDILFARTGASVGKTYQYKESDGRVYYAGFLIRARILSGFNPGFVFQNTLTKRYENFISITSQRSGQPGINAQEYAGFKLLLPKFEEQEQIAALFIRLDNLITLHQRKLDELKNMKKTLLQQMFV